MSRKKVTKATEATKTLKSTKMEEAMNQNEIAEVVQEEPTLPTVEEEEPKTPKAEKKPRAPRIFKLGIGRLPDNNQKPLGLHAVVITEAIEALIDEGRETATRDEIMAKAVELGLFDRKPSKQGVVPIFSWWRKILSSLGWLSQGENDEVSTEEDLPTEL